MGYYNPHRPHVLGQEWAPIRDADRDVDLQREVGHTYHLPQSATVVTGAFYVPGPVASGRVIMLSVYPESQVDRSGPIEELVIPCDGGTVASGASLSGAATVQEALAQAIDGKYVLMPALSTLNINFDFNSYATQLTGKRIVGIDLLYLLQSTSPIDSVVTIGAQVEGAGGSHNYGFAIIQSSVNTPAVEVSQRNLGDVNTVFPAVGSFHRYPWTYPQLQRFDNSTASGRCSVLLFTFSTTGGAATPRVDYAALRVRYCEEQRVAVGGTWFSLRPGQNLVHLRPVSTLVTGGVALAAGEYAVTVVEGDDGDAATGSTAGAVPLTTARQLYELTPQRGVSLTRTQVLGAEFQRDSSDLLTQLSLHTATASVTGVHAYGTSLSVPVYGAVTAVQEVRGNSAEFGDLYPWVRFYARRFGDTQSPLTLTRTGGSPAFTTSISAAELDALPEVLDGWREVTLRFNSPTPSFPGTTATTSFTFSATGLTAGSRWEVLGASAPGPTGTGALNVDPRTYDETTTAIGNPNLTWQLGDDLSSDLTLMFLQDPPTVTGIGVEVLSQPVTGVGTVCGQTSDCVPTAVSYHHVTWPARDVLDTFSSRTVVSGWGQAETGQSWTTETGPTADASVSGGVGVLSLSVVDSARIQSIDGVAANVDARATFVVPTLATGSAIRTRLNVRFNGTGTCYMAELELNTDQTVELFLRRCDGATISTLSPVPGLVHTVTRRFTIRVRALGSIIEAKVWDADGVEPESWQVSAVDLTTIAAGRLAVTGLLVFGNTNVLPVQVQVDDVSALNLDLVSFELQRSDDVDPDWQTIMLSTDLTIGEFNDYEARVGVPTRYRVRVLDVYGIAGDWSSEVTSTIPAPGVAVSGDGEGTLVFTSNERQDGSAVLAYTPVWESTVNQAYSLREGGDVVLHDVYRRNYPRAYHPAERGGEEFSVTLLVNSTAVALPSLANVRSLRDLAWEPLAYVCVRDDVGNRWFANVRVPAVNVRRGRRLYLAATTITEVTDVPAVISLGSTI